VRKPFLLERCELRDVAFTSHCGGAILSLCSGAQQRKPVGVGDLARRTARWDPLSAAATRPAQLFVLAYLGVRTSRGRSRVLGGPARSEDEIADPNRRPPTDHPSRRQSAELACSMPSCENVDITVHVQNRKTRRAGRAGTPPRPCAARRRSLQWLARSCVLQWLFCLQGS